MSDIADGHIKSKGRAYWDDLVAGTTSQYKEAVIEQLVREHFPRGAEAIIDIGCGTCDTALKYKRLLGARRVTCTDYDEKTVGEMRRSLAGEEVDWRVADIFALGDLGATYDLVFLMDMLHEVYSFYGRPTREPESPVDHTLGLQHVDRALNELAAIVRPGGGMVITDDVLCDEAVDVTVRMRRPEVVQAVKYFLENYPTRRMPVRFESPDVIAMQSRDLNILLTQYNKIKAENWERWKIERLEIHEYMSPSEFRGVFDALGFDVHMVVGTPRDAWQEWNADFEMLSGLRALPEKRITLLAIKR